MASTLESYVNRMVSIITADGRNFIGTLKGFDQTINRILDDTHERIYSPNQGVEQVSEQLGCMVTKLRWYPRIGICHNLVCGSSVLLRTAFQTVKKIRRKELPELIHF